MNTDTQTHSPVLPDTLSADSLSPSATFTEAVTALDSIVSQLRSPGVPLETALEQFEKGVKLVQQCQITLKQAGGKLEQLTATLDVVPFEG